MRTQRIVLALVLGLVGTAACSLEAGTDPRPLRESTVFVANLAGDEAFDAFESVLVRALSDPARAAEAWTELQRLRRARDGYSRSTASWCEEEQFNGSADEGGTVAALGTCEEEAWDIDESYSSAFYNEGLDALTVHFMAVTLSKVGLDRLTAKITAANITAGGTSVYSGGSQPTVTCLERSSCSASHSVRRTGGAATASMGASHTGRRDGRELSKNTSDSAGLPAKGEEEEVS